MLQETEAQTTLSVKSGNNTEIDPATYVDDKNLSSVTYGLVSGNTELLTVTENDGKFTVTAGTVTDDTDVTLTLKVYYKGGEVLTVNLTVKVVSGDKPVVNNPEIELPVDIYTLTDKTKIKLNFAGNIGNPANLTLNYKVTQVGQTDDAAPTLKDILLSPPTVNSELSSVPVLPSTLSPLKYCPSL